jgi:hypothetical protein
MDCSAGQIFGDTREVSKREPKGCTEMFHRPEVGLRQSQFAKVAGDDLNRTEPREEAA